MASIATETPTEQAPATAGIIELRLIALTDLVESPTNPRQRFDSKRLHELAASIKMHGLTHPLRVRPLDNGAAGKFEIISGHRRTRAARILKMTEIACNVGPMTDRQVRETQMIELEQSEGVHPLDLAEGYRRLRDAGDDVPAIVARIGKGIAWVYQTIKLCDLIPEAKKLFLDNLITYSHAINIAPYTPAAQKQILAALFVDKINRPVKPTAPDARLRSVRDLKQWIEQNLMLDLNKAAFNVADGLLVEEAGPCTQCPKRTGFKPELFPDIGKKDVCTDPACYQAKLQAFIQDEAAEIKKADGIPPLLISTDFQAPYGTKPPAGVTFRQKYEVLAPREQPCPAARKAIIVGGQFQLNGNKHTGDTVTVCTSATCRVHHPAGEHSNPDVARHQAREKKERAALEVYRKIRGAVLDGIISNAAGKKASFGRAEQNQIALATFRRIGHDLQVAVYKRHGWEPIKAQFTKDYDGPAFEKIVAKMTDAQLRAFQLEMALIADATISPYESPSAAAKMPPSLAGAARHFGVNPAAIARTITAASAAKAKPKADPGRGDKPAMPKPTKKSAARISKMVKAKKQKSAAKPARKLQTPVKKSKAGKKAK